MDNENLELNSTEIDARAKKLVQEARQLTHNKEDLDWQLDQAQRATTGVELDGEYFSAEQMAAAVPNIQADVERARAHIESNRLESKAFADDNYVELRDQAIIEATAAGKRILNVDGLAQPTSETPAESQVEKERRIPTDEELAKGLYLAKEEVIEFPLTGYPLPASHIESPPTRRTVYVGKDGHIKVPGCYYLAELRVGDLSTADQSVHIVILETSDKSKLVSITGTDVVQRLDPGGTVDIGRDVAGQEDLPTAISREHCSLSLDGNGRVVITNHNPTNSTVVRRFRSGAMV